MGVLLPTFFFRFVQLQQAIRVCPSLADWPIAGAYSGGGFGGVTLSERPDP